MIEFFIENKDFILQFIFGLFFAIIGYYVIYNSEKLEKKGIKTTGQVINYHEKYEYEEGKTFPKKYYYPIILFTDSNGTKHQVIDDFATSIKSNKKLPYSKEIYYLEENGVITISSNNYVKGIFGMIFLIIGIVIIIFTIIKYI